MQLLIDVIKEVGQYPLYALAIYAVVKGNAYYQLKKNPPMATRNRK